MRKLAIGIITGIAVNEGINFIKRKKEDIYFEKEGIEAVRRMYYKGHLEIAMIAEILDMDEEVIKNMVEKEEGQ